MAMCGTLAPDALGREKGEGSPTAIESESEVAPTEIDSESDEATPVRDEVEESYEPNSSHSAANSHPPSEPSASDPVDTLFRLWDEEPSLAPTSVDPFVALSAALPVSPAPLAPWVWPSEANVAEELRPMWCERKERAAQVAHGDIVFSAAQDLEASLRGIVSQGCAAFYVGSTVNPLRRWLGDDGMEQFGLGRGWRGTRGPMPGHISTWRLMKVCGLFEGAVARGREASLIAFGKQLWEEGSQNVALDARGVSASTPAYIYVVWR